MSIALSPASADIDLPAGALAKQRRTLRVSNLLAMLVIFGLIVSAWYLAAIYYNVGNIRLLDADQGQLFAWNRLTMWEQWGQALNYSQPVVPAPHQVAANLWSRLAVSPKVTNNLWTDLITTAVEAVPGFIIGSVAALVLAYLFVRSRILELSLFPYVVMSQCVPIIAIVPALILIMGIGFKSKVIVSAYLAFYPVTVSAVKGLRSVDPLGEDLMRSYAASGWQTLIKLKLPTALPYIFTGLKIGVTASLIGAIVSELTTGSFFGLGVTLLSESANTQYIALWATIIASGLLGLERKLQYAAAHEQVGENQSCY